MSNSINNSCSTKREDITLVLRNFNFPLPHAIKSPSIASNPSIITGTLSETNSTLKTFMSNDMGRGDTNSSTMRSSMSSSSSFVRTDTGLEPDQRIPAYVDFSEYYRAVEEGRKNGTLPEGIDF